MEPTQYTTFSEHHMTCVSPTPECEVMSRVSYPIELVARLGDKIMKSTRKLAVDKQITLGFSEIILSAIRQVQTQRGNKA